MHKKIVVKASGDGRTYALQLKDQAALNSNVGYSWEAPLPTGPRMNSVALDISQFQAKANGAVLTNVEPLDRSHIVQMGIKAEDTQPSSFELKLKSIGIE